MVQYNVYLQRPDGVQEIHNGDMKKIIKDCNDFISNNYKLTLGVTPRIISDLLSRSRLVNKIIKSIIIKVERTTPKGIAKKPNKNATIPRNTSDGQSPTNTNTTQHQTNVNVSQ